MESDGAARRDRRRVYVAREPVMTTSSSFRVLIATDGSPSANAALATAVGFPWPSGNRAQGVVVRAGVFVPPHALAWALSGDPTRKVALRRSIALLGAGAPNADVSGREGDPKAAEADLIVTDAQGRGAVDSLLFGSTTAHVLREASCPVLTLRAESPGGSSA